MVTFLPNDKRRVIIDKNGMVSWFLINAEGYDFFARIVNGNQLEVRKNPYSPTINIPKNLIVGISRQLLAAINSYKIAAESISEQKIIITKPWWTTDLAKCGIIILPDGKIGISRRYWKGKDPHSKDVILQKVNDLNKAIDMQKQIKKNYEDKAVADTDIGVNAELTGLTKRLNVTNPIFEIRQMQLAWANKKMVLTLGQSLEKIRSILKKTPETNRDQYGGLYGDLAELCFCLENNWPNPYAKNVWSAIEEIRRAKRLAREITSENITKIQFCLISARYNLESLVEAACRDNGSLIRLAKINPIKTLEKINRLSLENQIRLMAREKMPRREFFHLSELLAIAELLMDGDKPIFTPTATPVVKKNYRPKWKGKEPSASSHQKKHLAALTTPKYKFNFAAQGILNLDA